MILQARQRAMETVASMSPKSPGSGSSTVDGITAANEMIAKARAYARASTSPVKSPAPAVAYVAPAGDDLTGFLRTLDMEKVRRPNPSPLSPPTPNPTPLPNPCPRYEKKKYVPGIRTQGITSLTELRECNPTLADMKNDLGIDMLLHRKRL